MKKEDIKSGMLVKLRKGCWCLVIEYNGRLLLVNRDECQSDMSEFNNDLTDNKFDEFDIIAVARTGQNNLIRLEENDFNIIWERDEAKEMTIEEIEKELGYKIKIVK